MPAPSITYTFSNSTTADATQVNQNFTDLINGMSDGTKDFSISALTCAGVVTLNGNTTIGNASSDDLTITASLASTINIKTHNSYDIGTVTSKGLRAIYFASSSATNTAKLQGPAISSDVTHTLPTATGTLALDQNVFAQVFHARLTLTSGSPLPVSDQTARGTVYLTPYLGNKIGLYDGTRWNLHTLTEISIAVPATTSTMYDVFVYDNSGTLTLEAVAWTSDTARATAIVLQDGVEVKSGATSRRLCGSFRTTGVSGQTEDSDIRRFVSNRYNRAIRTMRIPETTDSWTYTTATYRQARASTANQLDYIQCVSEEPVRAAVVATVAVTTDGNTAVVGIGVDSTSTNSATAIPRTEVPSGKLFGITAGYVGYPGIGRHVLVWLEYSAASGTTTWYGDNGGSIITQSAIFGEVWN